MILGGAQVHVLYLCRLLDRERYDVQLLTGPELGPEGDLLSAARRAGVPTTVIGSLRREIRPWNDFRAYLALRDHLRREPYDIVHTNVSKAGILVRHAAREAGVPVIIHTAHGWQWTSARGGVMNRFIIGSERWAARFTDRIVVVAEKDREKGLAAGVGRPEQYALIESAIPLDEFDPDRVRGDGVKDELGIPAGAPVAGTVGRFAYQKAPEVMLAAARALLERLPNSHFIYVGDGPLRGDMEDRFGPFMRHPHLHLVGLRQDVPRVVAAMDVFLLSSRYEGLPRVVVEAMALGKPVVSTPADGVVEVVRDEVTGRLVPPGDWSALAEAAAALIESPERRRVLGTAARRIATERFGLEGMVTRTEKLYEELLASKGTRRGG